MTAGYHGKTLRPNLEDAIAQAVDADRRSLWTSLPGEVVSVSADGRTATIRPLYRPRFNGEPVDMPDLLDVPIQWPRGGGMLMRFPLKPGDQGEIRVQSRNIDDWYGKGTAEPGFTARMHDLSDSTFQPGLSAGTAPAGPYDGDNFELSSDDGQFRLKMSPDGKFEMTGAQGDIIALLEELCDLLAQDQLVIAYGSSAGTGHQLSNRAGYAAIKAKIAAMKIGG